MIYVVQTGDTIDQIADNSGVSATTILYINQLPYPYRLTEGQALLLPSRTAHSLRRPYESDSETIYVNGYAYPFISPWVLAQTLPYLTELSIFSYGFTPEGYLLPPLLEEQWMIDAARERGVLPILTLTPLDSQGRFNNFLISAVINNEEAKETLIEQLLLTLQEKGYQGVDIDFEYILATDRDSFTEFVKDVTTRLNANGYQVSVALAPKTSANQQGLLYAGKDYKGIGEAANSVLLMTYEWGYTYGPPMAVAPLNKVREVVEYAITEIPAEKIRLGIPNYGYDWPLPFQPGITKAKTIGNVEAVQLAIYQGVPIQFDKTAQSPFFRYVEEGITHEVWFEDVRSLNAKFDLIKEYQLAGAGYWQIMQLFRANWVLLGERFEIGKR